MSQVKSIAEADLDRETCATDRGHDDLGILADWLPEDRALVDLDHVEDLTTVAGLAVRSVVRFLQDPDRQDAAAAVVDGLGPSSRDPEVQAEVDALLDEVGAGTFAVNFVPARIGHPGLTDDADAVLPDGADAAIVYPGSGDPVVLVSSALGFRDMILVAQAAVVDILTDYLESAGLEPLHDGVSTNLLSLLRDGDVANPVRPEDVVSTGGFRQTISVRLDGQIVDASMVRTQPHEHDT